MTLAISWEYFQEVGRYVKNPPIYLTIIVKNFIGFIRIQSFIPKGYIDKLST
jgi:hypothetical protein